MALSIYDDDDLLNALGYAGRDYDRMIAESAWCARRARRAETREPRREPTAAELREEWRTRKQRLRQREEVRRREREYDIRRRRAEGHRPWSEYVVEVRRRAAERRPQMFFPWFLGLPSHDAADAGEVVHDAR